MIKKFLKRVKLCLKFLFGKEGEYTIIKNGPTKARYSGVVPPFSGGLGGVPAASIHIRLVPAIKFIIRHTPDCPSILWWSKTSMNDNKMASQYANEVDPDSGRVAVTVKANKIKPRFYLISEDITARFRPLEEGDNKDRGYDPRICYYIPPVTTYDGLVVWFSENIYQSPPRKTFTKHLTHVWEAVLEEDGYSYSVKYINNDKLWDDCDISGRRLSGSL